MAPGILNIVACSSIGLGFRHWKNPEKETPSVLDVLLLGTAVHVVVLTIISIAIQGPDEVFFNRMVAPPMLRAFPLATVLAGRVLADYQLRIRAESQVKLHEDLVRHLLGDSPLITLLLEPGTGRILEANPAALSFYGYSTSTLLQKRLQDLQVKEPVAMADKVFSEHGPGSSFLHQHHQLANGRIREVDVCTGTIQHEGQHVEILFVIDITERMESLRNIQEALEEREHILETAMDGFWITDDTYRIRDRCLRC